MRILSLTLALFVAAPVLSQDQELVDGQSVVLEVPGVPNLPANQFFISPGFFIDVPQSATALRVDLVSDSGRDVDVLLAREPFDPDADALTLFTVDAEYYSGGIGGTEFVTILDSASPPVSGQRWYMVVLAFSGDATSATLSVDIQEGPPQPAQVSIDFDNALGAADCDIAPWDDPTPFAATDGNNATTLGQARRNAMLEAARLIGDNLSSPVPITIRACWENLGAAEGGGATLASARTNLAFINTPGVPLADTIYVQAITARLAGTALCNIDSSVGCDEQDVFARFNTDVDSDVALGATRWYYGFTGLSGPDIDFIGTAIHEITHGLGFASFIDENGSLQTANDGTPLGDSYSANLIANASGQQQSLLDPAVSDAARAAALISGGGLQWSGPESSVGGLNTQSNIGDGFVRMHAPNPYDGGSSVSHLATTYCSLMTPFNQDCAGGEFRGLGIEKAMMHEIGWAPSGDRPPFLGLFYDRSRDGHGFEFQLGGVDPVLGPIYVLTFYSYETLGSAPEWFQAAGPIQNGVFYGLRSDLTGGFGLPTFNYDDGRSPPQQADPGRFGQVSFSFNDPTGSAACDDGVDRGSATVASFQWAIDNNSGDWCVEPVPGTESHPDPDFGGLWFAGEADTGWGFSLENILRPDGSIDLFVLLYVYAGDGTPVWYFGFAGGVDLGQPVDFEMFQRRGFNRLATNGSLLDTAAGSFTLTLGGDPTAGLDGSNRASVEVSYQSNPGGDWIRDDVAIVRLSQPRP